jgi:hypothetical protein
VKALSPQELREWRRKLPKGWQRAVSPALSAPRPPAETVGDKAGALEVPITRRQGPVEAHKQVLDGMRRNAFRSREDFQAAVRQLRKWSPGLIAHLTDEQAAQQLEDQWDRSVREAVQRVYRQRGRGDELVIRL